MKKFIYSCLLSAAFFLIGSRLNAQQNPCEGKANFQFTISNLTVNFYSLNTSNVVFRHNWRFGDGTSSEAANPVHNYLRAGVYRVVHYIKDDARNCYDSAVKEIRVGNLCDLLVPKFEWRRSNDNPNKIQFINQSQPNAPPTAMQYKWNFGDGTTSAEMNPVHLFEKAGQYNVCLTIRYANANCEKTFCTVVSISPTCNVQPNFTWAAGTTNPLKFQFTNQTLLPVSGAKARWTFGDGTVSEEWNPAHEYRQAGVYKVCLRVTLNNGCVGEICKEVVVRGCSIEPKFSWKIDSVRPLRGVQFMNETFTITANPFVNVKWSFGDGTGSTEWNPFHQYQQPGTYKVCLRIEFFAGCVKEVCKEVTIPAPGSCEKLSNFTYQALNATPNAYAFSAEINNSSLRYIWTFGDGTGAMGANARHQYLRPGRYTVCLTVYRDDQCASTTCKEITVGVITCEQTVVKYEYKRLNAAGNSIQFTGVGNQYIISQRWTIQHENGSTPVVLNSINPTYTFTTPGWYKVCLRALTANGCVKEYCELIRINPVSVNCSLLVAPNPATTNVTVRMQLEQAQPVVISVIDAMGVRRSTSFLNGAKGWNSFTINVATLPTGYYMLEVKYGNNICTARFQKVN
jgi:PKD repeat protein